MAGMGLASRLTGGAGTYVDLESMGQFTGECAEEFEVIPEMAPEPYSSPSSQIASPRADGSEARAVPSLDPKYA